MNLCTKQRQKRNEVGKNEEKLKEIEKIREGKKGGRNEGIREQTKVRKGRRQEKVKKIEKH